MPAGRDYGSAVKRRLFASSPNDRVVEYIQVEAKVSNSLTGIELKTDMTIVAQLAKLASGSAD